MSSELWRELAAAVLAELKQSRRYRQRRVIIPLDATHVQVDGRCLINFASNNYLGLSHHPRVVEAAQQALRTCGTGAGASPLVSGYGPAHHDAERRFAQWKHVAGCVLLPSGYQANHAAVQTLAAIARHNGRPIRFLLDKLCHASLIDAVRGSQSSFRVFPHNHLGKLGRLLEEADDQEIQVVVTESIFSMDGDAADLAGLRRLKRQRPFLLLLDEAHATGAYGAAGSGLTAELEMGDIADMTVITFSKAIGCAGGAVCGSAELCESVVNFARAYIYSTGLPPAVAASIDAAIDVMQREPQRQQRLRMLARRVREEVAALGLSIPPGDSPIVPIVMGGEEEALQAAEQLAEYDLFVAAIRPPTVPRGSSRLRVTLSCEHTDSEVDRLLEVLASLTSPRAS